MKGRGFFLVLLFMLSAFGQGLFAFGRKEVLEDPEPVNTEWTLCVTSLDVSSLPLSRQIIGETVIRSLAAALQNLDFRARGEEESVYYRDSAWSKARADAVRAIEAKRAERDLLLYRGEPSWKYRKNLKAVNAAIVKLEEELAIIDRRAPTVEGKPALKLTDGNIDNTFPVPPPEGNEYAFCSDQRVDGFLVGSLSEYHDRTYLSVKVYTLYSRSWSFEDHVLFSSENFNEAMDEISIRLAAAVTGIHPSGILVHTSPDDAMVLVDSAYASQGERLVRSPGEAEVVVRADNYVPVSIPLELSPGELAELYFDLTPFGTAVLAVDVPGSPPSKVFLGGLYAGDTPMTLELPKSELSYISVETPEGEIGSMVYRDNSLVRGSARFTRTGGDGGAAAFTTKMPIPPEDKRVQRARNGFYGAYGAFWVILPISLVAGGMALNYIYAYNYGSQIGAFSGYDEQKAAYDRAVTSQYIYYGANILWGTALGVTLFQIVRYLYISHKVEAAPIVKGIKE